MEICTIFTLEYSRTTTNVSNVVMRTDKPNLFNFSDFKHSTLREGEKTTVHLTERHLLRFDQQRDFCRHFYPNVNPTDRSVIQSLSAWVLLGDDRAGRVIMSGPLLKVQFIEFGDKESAPLIAKKLFKALKKLKKDTQHETVCFAQIFKIDPSLLTCCDQSLWLKFERAGGKMSFSMVNGPFTPEQNYVSVYSPDIDDAIECEWMKNIVLCLRIGRQPSDWVQIEVKKPSQSDQTIMFARVKGKLQNYRIFLTILKILMEASVNTSIIDNPLVNAGLSLVPFVGSGLAIRDCVKDFKDGKTKSGVGNLVIGTVGLVADSLILLGPAVRLISFGTRSGKVAKACSAVLKAKSEIKIAGQVTKTAAQTLHSVIKSHDSQNTNTEQSTVSCSDPTLLGIVFPRLACTLVS